MEAPHDYLIIGAGPAGLQLGYYLEQAGRDYHILEAGDSPGTFFKTYPRHRKLISINKVYTGFEDRELNQRWDWNSLLSDDDTMLFKRYSARYFPPADQIVRYLGDFAERFQLKITCGAAVTRISKPDLFVVEDQRGRVYRARRLIVATGVSQPYIPPIPGAELAERYVDVSVAPEDFTNQRVLIIGKGNSAFETADNLVETAAVLHLISPGTLKLAWKTHYVGHLRAVNNNLLDTYLLKSQNGLIDATIDRITRRDDGMFVVDISYTRAVGAGAQLLYDRVILCTGFRFDAAIFDESCRPELVYNSRFPALTSAWESTNVTDMYFAGTITQSRDFKKTQSGFIHGFRHNIEALAHILEQRYHGLAWPGEPLPLAAAALTDAALDRFNRSGSLWLQTGFLCDVIVVDAERRAARHYRTLPAAYVHDSAFGDEEHYYTLALEYGPDYPDYPFEFHRHVEHDQAHLNPQLHPIVRRFSRGQLVAEYHVLETLEASWPREEFGAELDAFFERQLAAADVGAEVTLVEGS